MHILHDTCRKRSFLNILELFQGKDAEHAAEADSLTKKPRGNISKNKSFFFGHSPHGTHFLETVHKKAISIVFGHCRNLDKPMAIRVALHGKSQLCPLFGKRTKRSEIMGEILPRKLDVRKRKFRHYRIAVNDFSRAWRASARSMSLVTSSLNGTPLASHIFGYMLIEVNPGKVLTSLMRSLPSFV